MTADLVRALERFMELEPARVDQKPYEMAVYDKAREVLQQAKGEAL